MYKKRRRGEGRCDKYSPRLRIYLDIATSKAGGAAELDWRETGVRPNAGKCNVPFLVSEIVAGLPVHLKLTIVERKVRQLLQLADRPSKRKNRGARKMPILGVSGNRSHKPWGTMVCSAGIQKAWGVEKEPRVPSVPARRS